MPIRRRELLSAALTGAAGATVACLPAPAAAAAEVDQRGGLTGPRAGDPVTPRTLRLAFPAPESTFDPVSTNSDVYSTTLIAHILEAPLAYDYLARPVRLVPNTAAALPDISADGRVITLRLRPGIYFSDDPAFHTPQGRRQLDAQGRRELVAQDYVYSIKRFFDPRYASSDLYIFEGAKLTGMDALRERALKTRKPFDYDTEVPGLRALDRYTLRIEMGEPDPRWVYVLAQPGIVGAVAREVVEHYGEDIGAHPVGTGPFRLAKWRRASRIELERSPTFRPLTYEGTPAPDERSQQLAAELKGQRLPRVDRVIVDIVEEHQPRWLAFLQGDYDFMAVPSPFVPLALPGGQLAPFLRKRGVTVQTALQPMMAMHYFAMEDPVVGGYTPEKVALRRAIGLAYDGPRDRQLLRNGMAIPAQSTLAPFTSGYDPAYKSEMSDHDPVRARALLDTYGYLDRDGDGWREQPNGQPLVLRIASAGSQAERQANELWKRSLNAVGMKVEFEISTWPELLKKTRTGALQIWGFQWGATSPDGGFFLSIAYGPNAGDSNDPRFKLPAFDRLFEQQRRLPDGPEREALIRQAKDLLVAYMPYKVHYHAIVAFLAQPWTRGYQPHPFSRDIWQYVGVER